MRVGTWRHGNCPSRGTAWRCPLTSRHCRQAPAVAQRGRGQGARCPPCGRLRPGKKQVGLAGLSAQFFREPKTAVKVKTRRKRRNHLAENILFAPRGNEVHRQSTGHQGNLRGSAEELLDRWKVTTPSTDGRRDSRPVPSRPVPQTGSPCDPRQTARRRPLELQQLHSDVHTIEARKP